MQDRLVPKILQSLKPIKLKCLKWRCGERSFGEIDLITRVPKDSELQFVMLLRVKQTEISQNTKGKRRQNGCLLIGCKQLKKCRKQEITDTEEKLNAKLWRGAGKDKD